MIVLDPIENFSPLRHSSLVAEAIGEIVPEYLASLRVLAHPYRVTPSQMQYDLSFDDTEVSSGAVTSVTLSHTATGTETVSEVTTNIVNDYNTQGFPVFAEAVVDYNEDAEMYLTVVAKEGYRITSAPTPVNMTIDTDVKVQAAIGKPASYGMGQKVLEQDYPRLIVTSLPMTTVSENWATGSLERDIGTGDGLRFYPYYDRYIRSTYQVTVEAGSIDEVLQTGRLDSAGIIQKFLNKIREENTRNGFWQKVQGTLSRDFTITPIPSLDYTDYQDISTMTFSLDMIVRDVVVEGNIITKTTMTGGEVVNQDGTNVNPVDFEIQAPSHP